MSENMIDALLQLAASGFALFWWWRAEHWKSKYETERAKVELRDQMARMMGG